ncbi:hypothetical protein Tco_0529182 [Tanacetum coccineum]
MVSSAYESSPVESGSLNTTPLEERINKLERNTLDRKLMLVDDDEKSLNKVDSDQVSVDKVLVFGLSWTLRSNNRQLTITRKVVVWVSINSNKEADRDDFQGSWKLVSVQVLRQEKGSKVDLRSHVRAPKGVEGLLLGYTTRFTIKGFLKVLLAKGLDDMNILQRVLVVGFKKNKVRMKALLKQQGLATALEELPATTIVKKLDTFNLHPGKSQSEHVDEFYKLTLLYGRDTLKPEDVFATLDSRELKITEAKGDDGEGLYARGRSLQRDMEHGIITKNLNVLLGIKLHVSCSRAHKYDSFNVMMVMSVEELLDWIMDSEGSYHITYKRDYLVDFEEYDGGIILLDDGRKCRSGLSKVFWAEDTTMSTYVVNRSPSSTIRFKTPIDMLGFLVGLIVLSKGCLNRLRSSAYSWDTVKNGEYKKTFIGSGVALAREQHSTRELFRYREDRNKAAFAVAAAEYQSGNTLRVSQFRFYNEKLVQTSLEGHSIVSLEGSLSEDCDVEKNGKWSCIYVVESLQVYHGVCTRPDISSEDVDQSQAANMTLTEAAKEVIWLKRLTIESGFKLKILVDIATVALSKAIPGLRFQHRLSLLSIGIG